MKVLVLHDVVPDGAPPDQVDAIVQAELVRDVLAGDGHHVEVDAFRLDPGPILAARPDVVVNLVETIGGDGRLAHLAPALFELLRIPFTGAGSAALAVSTHKRLGKRALASFGVAVPEDWPLGGPRYLVKSLWEHASVGLDDDCLVDHADVPGAIERLRTRLGGEVVAETYIDGRELNVSLLQDGDGVRVMPIAEIAFDLPPGRPRIVGYKAKWDPDSVEWAGTPRTFDVPGISVAEIEGICRRCWSALRLRGYARVDLRVPDAGPAVVLEVNANPCLAPDAGFAAAVAQGGISIEEAIRSILANAEF